MTWRNVQQLNPKIFKCGHCGEKISSQTGFSHENNDKFQIFICHTCDCPNVFFEDKQYPGVVFGNKVENIHNENIEKLYDETRQCVSVQAFTSSVMASRKLLMNIAVQRGAKEGLSFKEYVEYLDTKHYIPPDGKDWVDQIRRKGNEANHEIKIMEKEDAEELITFIEMLLKFIYEFPSKVKKKEQPAQP